MNNFYINLSVFDKIINAECIFPALREKKDKPIYKSHPTA